MENHHIVYPYYKFHGTRCYPERSQSKYSFLCHWLMVILIPVSRSSQGHFRASLQRFLVGGRNLGVTLVPSFNLRPPLPRKRAKSALQVLNRFPHKEDPFGVDHPAMAPVPNLGPLGLTVRPPARNTRTNRHSTQHRKR